MLKVSLLLALQNAQWQIRYDQALSLSATVYAKITRLTEQQ